MVLSHPSEIRSSSTSYRKATFGGRAGWDDAQSLELHHIIDRDMEKVHSDGIVVAFLPKEKILFQADFTLPQPGAKPNPFVQSLGENLARLKLDFDSYLSVHTTNAQQTRTELMKAVGISY